MGVIAAREDIPAPNAEGLDSVALPASSCAMIELYITKYASKVDKAVLASHADQSVLALLCDASTGGTIYAMDDSRTIRVVVPDIEETITFGDDHEDAQARACVAIERAIIGMK